MARKSKRDGSENDTQQQQQQRPEVIYRESTHYINIDYIIVVISCAAMLVNRINNSERIYIHNFIQSCSCRSLNNASAGE